MVFIFLLKVLKQLSIKWDKVLLSWNRGHKNLWDELILIWLVKILLAQKKKIFIACTDKIWLENFHKQFFNTTDITYVYELPKWFRSSRRFLKNIKDLKYYFLTDAIIVGGGEILTEETPYSYRYWLASVYPFLFFKKFYLMGGVQIPQKARNKIPFKLLTFFSEKIYTRDRDLLDGGFLPDKIEFFPDTSFFIYDKLDFANYRWDLHAEDTNKSIIVNLNKKAEKFKDEIYSKINTYASKNYKIYFAYICKSPNDDDIQYFNDLKKTFPNIELLDYEPDFWDFTKHLKKSEKIFCSRLHLFLVSHYLNCDVSPFVYEKKVEKMKKLLNYK